METARSASLEGTERLERSRYILVPQPEDQQGEEGDDGRLHRNSREHGRDSDG